MTVLYISELKVHQDDLGRYVTTLTQEVMAKINANEERIFIDTLVELDSNEGDGEYIQYHRDDYSELDVQGIAIKKAMDTINSINKVIHLAPITEIHDNDLYRVEIEY